MSTNQKVQCCTHGEMDYALVCTHLANQADNAGSVTYYVADDDSDPDRSSVENVWCGSCDEVLIREGDWNDVSEAHADIKVICIACLEQIKKHNVAGAFYQANK